ncbi:hypothetical protein [Streptomyces glaucus]|uniref:Uncharacterized protein n=1 Tax=Streptomyces glaucus TaxID=284029 RepID=A0ABN3JWM0_9ACTN
MLNNAQTTQSAEWPAGVIARYLTVGGATADVLDKTAPWRTGFGHTLSTACTGELCDWTRYGTEFWFDADEDPWGHDGYRSVVRRLQDYAQAHAEKCRALPRPGVGA